MLNLGLSAAHAREIKLIGTLSELRDTRQLRLRGLGEADLKIQSREKLVNRECLRLEIRPFDLLFIHCRPLPVFRGYLQAIECPDMTKKLGDLFLRWQLQRQNLRATRPDLGTLERIVVDKNEAIQPEVQFLRK